MNPLTEYFSSQFLKLVSPFIVIVVLQALAVPLGDLSAHRALEKNDLDAAVAGFKAGTIQMTSRE